MSPPRRTGHSLNDVARNLAPHLRIISASRPTPLLRDHNVLAIATDPEVGRRAVLAMETIEHADDRLGTVVMAAVPNDAAAVHTDDDISVDPEGVGRQVIPRVLLGALVGAVAGAVLIGGGALLFGATSWSLVAAAGAGAALTAVFGAIWLTFAGLGGSDAYRQTFVDEGVSEMTIVSVHTDDPDEAAAARTRLEDDEALTVLTVDRFGHVFGGPQSSSNTR